MHDYSIDKHPKEKILFFLALIAITTAPLLQDLADKIVAYLQVNTGWSSAPVVAVPVFAIFAGLYFLFNKYLWRVDRLRRILLVPDLNGTWDCKGQTTLKNGVEADYQWNATITITQSWSKILIHLKTTQSESKSISASIFHEDGVGYRLLYQYNNNPNANELDLLNHSGSAELLFSEDMSSASGSYFTDRHRTTVGTMNLTKESK
ncbi:MAG: hypothetical protein H6974_15555 [Gammaproteobacteria bacterium]|nr:hypothetical protein [Candidatus Competibacteraceae bacterium]MCP5198171.1 hypothetical protein [Gammaproteobacteria bacterium]